ncbi:hypothetical protein L3049_13400 [Labilibaculum sp. DW002]|jgi:hypothetical protein|uniref:Uncharacterized protein n=1 Tax=Paralabilibaculum antarcticum TaxID=2912572 RepID=A0ABT5VUM3_9BACT|nr:MULTISPECIES: hypothetical protein [unclassified Labilibaculum]MBI9058047.1 hypothetical protein [Labilibaculum sp.]MDE5418996.1 hypothetical protein [Labilibaculum sp. DW002]
MKSKINLTPVGTVIGILVPILSILLVYLIKFQAEMSMETFIDSLFVHRIYTKVLALGVYFGNIAFFFLFIKMDWLKAARGVLLATILYSLAIMLFRIGM